jgi:hypothetical protein
MKELHSLSLTRLSILEIGQHIKSVNQGIAKLGFPIDADFLAYMNKSNQDIIAYDKAMLQIRKSDETEKIAIADEMRDKALSALFRQLNVFEVSDNENEVLAYKSLNTVFKTYKGLQNWNFEAESNGIDNFIADLNSSKYKPSILLLKMDDLVTRVTNSNNAFKTLFAGRIQETAVKIVYDTKALRTEMSITYNDMIAYVLVMAKAKNNDEFSKSLGVINTVRKYYADLLAKRKPATPTTPAEPIPPMPTS